jgi:hypothetical protein
MRNCIIKVEIIDDRIEPKTTFYFENGETKTFTESEVIIDKLKFREYQRYWFWFLLENFRYLYKKQPEKYKETELYKYLSILLEEPLLSEILKNAVKSKSLDNPFLQNLYYAFINVETFQERILINKILSKNV